MEPLQASDLLLPWSVGAVFVFAFGLVIGSFLNVVIHRVPRGESLVRPGSHCPGCARPIRPAENVPMLSYAFLRGRCRGCGARISARYPLIEGLTALVFLAIYAVQGVSFMLPVWMGFAAALIAAAGIDFDEQWIPDEISVGGLGIGLVLVPLVATLDGASYTAALGNSLLGAAIGGGMLWAVGFVHARVSVGLGRRFDHWPGDGEPLPRPSSLDYWVWFPGIGFGDVKLLAMIGAFLGPTRVIETIVAAALAGLLLGGAFAVVRRSTSQPFGFGPAIALGAVLVLASPVHLG